MIKNIKAREILNSKGNFTVEVELETGQGVFHASCPSGASKGINEAVEIKALEAVKNVNEIIGPKLKRKNPLKQKEIDEIMIELDGTENKSKLGANAILPVSLAVCRAGAAAKKLPLYQYIKEIENCKLSRLKVEDPRFKESGKIENLRIGVPREYFVKGMDKEVEKIIKQSIKKIEAQGAKIEEINLPHTKYVIPTYYLVAMSEASANLARYDGIKYGLSRSGGKDLLSVYLKSRAEGFGNEVKRRIMLGTYVLSAGYYDAYYLKAQKVRTLIKQDFDKVFEKVDVIFSPVSPFPAFKLGEKTVDPLSMYLTDIFTASINLAGLPAVSIPVGWVGKLPVGLQIIGKPFEENRILEIGKTYEKNE